MATISIAAAACSLTGCPSRAAKPVMLIVSGDTSGFLVPCGCTSNQSGGLLRRGTYVSHIRETHDVLLADAGGAARGESEYDRLKFEAILAGEREMGVVAHNLGAAEVQLGADYIRKAIGKGVSFLSCNVRDTKGELLAPTHRLITIGEQRLLLVGVLSPHSKGLDRTKLRLDPPREAILAAAEQQKANYDRLIVLAYLPEDELLDLARNLPEADAIIGGPTGQSIAPKQIGPTLVAAATNKGKFIAQISIPPLGSPHWQGEIVELTERFADHEPQTANLKQFYASLEAANFAPEQTSFAPSLPADPPAGFQTAGSDACRECHAAEHEKWATSAHAHGWQSLTKTGAQVDSDCQRCHTTNYGFPGGFVSAKRSLDRTGIGCESCHGPSKAHADRPEVHTAFFRLAEQQCTSCHDRENSPKFTFSEYWSRIAHGTTPAERPQP